MPIDLGLARVTRLLSHLNNPHLHAFKSIHVAGTNGKGSTVSYLSSILTKASIRNGRFTSPHILHYNDCVCINNEVYPLTKFQKVSQAVQEKNKVHGLGCTEFELLTVTAFKIFELERVEVAIIEVGLGGRLDATNVLEAYSAEAGGGVIATGITKIGLDHESFLGDTLGKIAFEKAGILKKGVPSVVDRTNENEALSVVRQTAQDLDVTLYEVDGLQSEQTDDVQSLLASTPLKGEYQKQNLSIALKIIEILTSTGKLDKAKLPISTIQQGIKETSWRGRLQSIKIPSSGLEIILDGAHNESAALELGKYLQQFRTSTNPGIIYIVGITKGKDVKGLFKHVVDKKHDKIVVTGYTPPENMPWVSSYPIEELQKISKEYVDDVDNTELSPPNVVSALRYVAELKRNGDTRQVVVFGSLYLGSDVLRYIEEKQGA